MLIIKCIMLFLIFLITTTLGFKLSQKFNKREIELKEMKSALNMFKSKIKYTYESLPDTFNDISQKYSKNIANIFNIASLKMQEKSAGDAWNIAVDSSFTYMNDEDKSALKSLSKMLGKTDLDGQLKEIELTENFLNYQIEKAEKERQKNEKMYKSLGIICGVGLVILFM